MTFTVDFILKGYNVSVADVLPSPEVGSGESASLDFGSGNGHGCGEARGKGTAWRKGGEGVEHLFVSWNEEIQDGYSKKHLAPFYLWCEHRDLWLIDDPSY